MRNGKEDVFICYSRSTGAELAQLFRARLEREGVHVFLDVAANYWGPFPKALSDRVAQTPFFLVLLTAGCLGSQWMTQEIAQALRSQRKIIVVRHHDLELPAAHEAAWPWSDLLLLNHITYAHEFTDEVLQRVITQLNAGRRRTRMLTWIGVAAATTTILTAAYGYKRLSPPAASSRTASHPLTVGGTAASAGAPAPAPSALPSEAPHQRTAARAPLPYLLLVRTDPPAANVRVGGTMVPAPHEFTLADNALEPIEVVVTQAGYVSSTRSIWRSEFIEYPDAWRAQLDVALQPRERTRGPKQSQASPSWCYWKDGYDPTLGDMRRECTSFRSLEDCENDRKLVLSSDSLWTHAEECTRCTCKPQ